MLDLLHKSDILRLFLVIGVGYLLGNLRLRGFSLGVAGVLFTGLALGAWQPGKFEVAHTVSTLGLVLFVYTIGLASGPGVFEAFRSRDGVRLNALTLAAVGAAALTAVAAGRLFGLPPAETAGLFCGGVTNTPALAASVELQQRRGADPNAPVVGYSMAYPFGVLGVFAVMGLISRRVDLDREKARYEQDHGLGGGDVSARNYRVTRLKPNGNQLEAGWLREQCGLVVSRRLHEGSLKVVEPDAVLSVGDVVLAVGTEEMHKAARELLGDPSEMHLELRPELTYRRFLVSNDALVGKRLGDLQVEATLHCTITRIRRGDVEMPAAPGFKLQEGDVVWVVTRRDNFEEIRKFFGDSLEAIAHTDFISFSAGIMLGVLLGQVPLPLGPPPHPTLGVAGGTLIAALALGRLARTGPIVWTLSLESNLTLRQLGLSLFLAAVGITAGGQFASAMGAHGPVLLLAGAMITLSSVLVLAVGGRLVLKENLVPLLGVMAGAHTQPACLAYSETLVRSQGVNIGYSAVFPVAMVAKIALASAMLTLLR